MVSFSPSFGVYGGGESYGGGASSSDVDTTSYGGGETMKSQIFRSKFEI